jgi:glycosyltransferase involved in cell wall biosynthesis
MELSIVFPAYNEEGNIEKAVQDSLAYLGSRPGEVLVVNDGSRDRTAEILSRLEKAHPGRVRALHHEINQGYAPTLRDGFLAAKGEWIFYSDSDNQFVLKELDLLMNLRDGVDMVVGYRKDRQDPAFRKFAAGTYNFLVRLFFGLRGVRDIDCAFKLFHRSVFQKIKIESSHFLIDGEILIKAQHLNMKIKEVGVTHLPREVGTSTVRFFHVTNTLAGLAKLYWRKITGNL